MPQTKRGLLAGENCCPCLRLIFGQNIQHCGFIAGFKRLNELWLQIEMIFDDVLVAPGYKDEVFNPRFPRLVHRILNHGHVDHCQHFLWNGFGRGQEACAQASDGKDGLALGRWVVVDMETPLNRW